MKILSKIKTYCLTMLLRLISRGAPSGSCPFFCWRITCCRILSTSPQTANASFFPSTNPSTKCSCHLWWHRNDKVCQYKWFNQPVSAFCNMFIICVYVPPIKHWCSFYLNQSALVLKKKQKNYATLITTSPSHHQKSSYSILIASMLQ